MEEFRRALAMTARSALAWVLPAAALLACAGSAEETTVVVRNLSSPGSFEVENRGPAVDLAWQVTVERHWNGQWTDEVTDLTLIEKCGQPPPPACVRLAHAAKLRPVGWNGLTCGSQCAATCRANIYLGPGRFRFVVSSCDGQHKFPGPAWDVLTGIGKMALTQRAR